MTTLTLRIPLPPSVNAAYGNRPAGGKGRGRYATKELERWREAAGKEIMLQARGLPRPLFPGRFALRITATVREGADCDNRLKPVPDLLKTMGIIMDDRGQYMRLASVRWVDRQIDGCEVRLRPLSGNSAPARQNPPRRGAEGIQAAHRRADSVPPATGERRGSETPLTNIKHRRSTGTSAVLAQLRKRGINVPAERVHVNGGGQP